MFPHGRIHIAVVRPPYKTPEDVTATLDYARAHLGKPYDGELVGNKLQTAHFNLVGDSKGSHPR